MDEQDMTVDILFEWKKSIMSSIEPTLNNMLSGLLGTTFTPNVDSGELEYDSDVCNFYVNEETGNLEWEDI